MDARYIPKEVLEVARHKLAIMAKGTLKDPPYHSIAIHPKVFFSIIGTKTSNIGTQTDTNAMTTEIETIDLTESKNNGLVDSSTQTDDSLLFNPEKTIDKTKPRVLPDWLNKFNQLSINKNCNSALLSQSGAVKRKAESFPNNKIPKLNPVPFVFNDKAVKNLTNIDIPHDILLLLSLGPKFIPPITKFDRNQVISDISKLKDCSNSVINNNALKKTLDLVQKYKNNEPNWRHQYINGLVDLTTAFIADNPNLFIDVSDKGNITIIMTEQQYHQKVMDKLSNNIAYSNVLVPQHERLMKSNYTLLLRCAEEGFVKHGTVMDIISNETKFSQVYGLVKAHKPESNYPVRLINSNVNVIGNKLANIILPILNKMNANDIFSIPNSEHFVQKLRRLGPKEDDMLFSLDIVDMFTNISTDEAWEIINKHTLKDFTNMSPGLFKDIFNFITKEATEFKFEHFTYKMNFGLPMGVPTSPVIACLVTTQLLSNALKLIEPVTYMCKYVDDIFIITNRNNLNKLLGILNAHPSLKFKMEEEHPPQSINYLDVSIFRKDDRFDTKWYCKPYASNRLINWFSAHDKHIATNTAINFVRNMFNLTSYIYKEEIEFLAYDILKKNSFPEGVAKNIIDNINHKRYPINQEQFKYIGTSAPNALLAPLNTTLKNSVQGESIRFVNKSFSQNLSNKIFSSRKSEESFERRNFLILELSCKDCTFKCISPIIYPIVVFNVFDIQYEKHPFIDIKKHISASKHSGFEKKIIRQCENKAETLRLAEIEASNRGLTVHALAHKSNAEIVRKTLNLKNK